MVTTRRQAQLLAANGGGVGNGGGGGVVNGGGNPPVAANGGVATATAQVGRIRSLPLIELAYLPENVFRTPLENLLNMTDFVQANLAGDCNYGLMLRNRAHLACRLIMKEVRVKRAVNMLMNTVRRGREIVKGEEPNFDCRWFGSLTTAINNFLEDDSDRHLELLQRSIFRTNLDDTLWFHVQRVLLLQDQQNIRLWEECADEVRGNPDGLRLPMNGGRGRRGARGRSASSTRTALSFASTQANRSTSSLQRSSSPSSNTGGTSSHSSNSSSAPSDGGAPAAGGVHRNGQGMRMAGHGRNGGQAHQGSSSSMEDDDRSGSSSSAPISGMSDSPRPLSPDAPNVRQVPVVSAGPSPVNSTRSSNGRRSSSPASTISGMSTSSRQVTPEYSSSSDSSRANNQSMVTYNDFFRLREGSPVQNEFTDWLDGQGASPSNSWVETPAPVQRRPKRTRSQEPEDDKSAEMPRQKRHRSV